MSVSLVLLVSRVSYAADLVVDGTTQTLDGTQSYDNIQVINGGTLYITDYTGSGTTGTLTLEAETCLLYTSPSPRD